MEEYYIITAWDKGDNPKEVFAHVDRTPNHHTAMWVLRAEDADRFSTTSEAEDFFANHKDELVKDDLRLYTIIKSCFVFERSLQRLL